MSVSPTTDLPSPAYSVSGTMENGPSTMQKIRIDLLMIADMVEPGSRVLDVGCGNGELLELLAARKNVDSRGIELSHEGVQACVSRGLSVIQGDADMDLANYPADSFDYAILSQTLQATRHPRSALEHLARIGRRAIVSFPNFGYWKVRWYLLRHGRMPITDTLPVKWYDTQNIHFCTLLDFVDLTREMGLIIEQSLALDGYGRRLRYRTAGRWTNLMAQQALFLLRTK